MHNLSKMNTMTSLDSHECSCFGPTKSLQEQFLRQPDRRSVQTHIRTVQQLPAKQMLKRSLKRAYATTLEQSQDQKAGGSHEWAHHQRTPSASSTKDMLRQVIQKAPDFDHRQRRQKMESQQQSRHYYTMAILQPTFSIFQTHQTATMHPKCQTRPPQHPRTFINQNFSAFQLVSPNKIMVSTLSPSPNKEKTIQMGSSTQAYSCKDSYKAERSPTNISRNNDSPFLPLNTQIQSQSHALQQTPTFDHIQISSVSSEPTDHCILFSPVHDEHFEFSDSKHPLQRSWDCNYQSQFISPKMSWQFYRKQQSSLKQIEDVEEICSLGDSQEDSESDKESIVLERMNKCASMIEKKVESKNI